jgi:hypothetical protein
MEAQAGSGGDGGEAPRGRRRAVETAGARRAPSARGAGTRCRADGPQPARAVRETLCQSVRFGRIEQHDASAARMRCEHHAVVAAGSGSAGGRRESVASGRFSAATLQRARPFRSWRPDLGMATVGRAAAKRAGGDGRRTSRARAVADQQVAQPDPPRAAHAGAADVDELVSRGAILNIWSLSNDYVLTCGAKRRQVQHAVSQDPPGGESEPE